MLACRTRTLPSLSCQVQAVPENPRWPPGCLLAPCESPNTSMPTCSLAVCRVQRQPLSRPAAMERRSFGFETTLASRSFGPRIRRLIAAGYECHLVFLWLPSADFAVARVADRVRLGGHTVPEETIRRRYRSGLRNFFSLYQTLTTTWRMHDNSVHQPRLVASGAGRETLVANDVALWRRIRAEAGHG